jgi:hypothetical protein
MEEMECVKGDGEPRTTKHLRRSAWVPSSNHRLPQLNKRANRVSHTKVRAASHVPHHHVWHEQRGVVTQARTHNECVWLFIQLFFCLRARARWLLTEHDSTL